MARPGRPRAARTDRIWSIALRRAALKNVEGQKGLKRIDAAAEAVVKAMIGGDISASKEFGDRMEGKPAQAITGEDGGPISVTIRKFSDA